MPSPMIHYRSSPRDVPWLAARSHESPRPDATILPGSWCRANRDAQRRFAALLPEAEAEAVQLVAPALDVALAVLGGMDADLDEVRAVLEDALQGPLGRAVGLTPAGAGRLVGALRPWHLCALLDLADRRRVEKRRRRA